MSAGVIDGNVQGIYVLALTISPASVAANTTAEQLFTLGGVRPTDIFADCTKPTNQAGLGIANFRVSDFNQVAISFSNNTAGAIVPTAGQTYLVTIVRPDTPLLTRIN